MANIAYVLTTGGDGDAAEQKDSIRAYAETKNLSIDNYITIDIPSVKSERKQRIQELFSDINRWDTIIISDIARLGQNISEIIAVVRGFSERGIRFAAARQDIELNNPSDASSKAAAVAFDMLAELESHFASARIKKALALKKGEGAVLGRPKGSLSSSKLDDRKEIIVDYLAKGVSKTSLARILDTSPSNLLSYLKTRKIAVTKKTRSQPREKPENDTSLQEVKENGPKGQAMPKPEKEKNVVMAGHADALDVSLCRHCGKNMLDPRTTTCAGDILIIRTGSPFVAYPIRTTRKTGARNAVSTPGVSITTGVI
jgi:DNA invertase Pin-like site-specific DNA recombinase